jgi:hypothetical protein
VPPYVRKSPRVSSSLPWLYLRGVSTGDMGDALSELLGEQAKGLSASVVSRLKAAWSEEYEKWSKRDLSASRWVYWWADGIHTQARTEDSDGQCLLVIIGVKPDGSKERVALNDGYRESKESSPADGPLRPTVCEHARQARWPVLACTTRRTEESTGAARAGYVARKRNRPGWLPRLPLPDPEGARRTRKGGAQSYLHEGVLRNGYALVAWPAQYGATGVMSFIVNQDGQLYEKDLGPQGARIASMLGSFDPDSSWKPIHP